MSEAVAEDLRDLDGWKAYVAGPPVMAEATMEVATWAGLRAQDLHADVFFTPSEGAAPPVFTLDQRSRA